MYSLVVSYNDRYTTINRYETGADVTTRHLFNVADEEACLNNIATAVERLIFLELTQSVWLVMEREIGQRLMQKIMDKFGGTLAGENRGKFLIVSPDAFSQIPQSGYQPSLLTVLATPIVAASGLLASLPGNETFVGSCAAGSVCSLVLFLIWLFLDIYEMKCIEALYYTTQLTNESTLIDRGKRLWMRAAIYKPTVNIPYVTLCYLITSPFLLLGVYPDKVTLLIYSSIFLMLTAIGMGLASALQRVNIRVY